MKKLKTADDSIIEEVRKEIRYYDDMFDVVFNKLSSRYN